MSDLAIIVGEYVLVQEGQFAEGEMVIVEDVSVVDVPTVILRQLLIDIYDIVFVYDGLTDARQIDTFDPVLAQDSPAVQPLTVTVAVSAFDIVIVQEGQTDSTVVPVSVFEVVTLTESATIALTLLRVNIFDVVTVLDVNGIFAQGPLGAIAIETVIVQEALERYLSLYINASDDVLVVDGALAPDIFDAVTVAEDVTVKLARLLVSGFDAVTITESQEIVGLAYGVNVHEDLVTSESVTLLLSQLRPSAFSDVTVAEAVTVAVSGIDLSVNVFESVTIIESVENQTNPIQIDEFTEIIVEDVPLILTGLLLIDSSDTVTVSDVLDLRLLPIQLEVFEDISITERIALRIGRGGRKRHDLTVVGAGE